MTYTKQLWKLIGMWKYTGLLLLLFATLLAGCSGAGLSDISTKANITLAKRLVIKDGQHGPIVIVFTPHEISSSAPAGGIVRAATETTTDIECSAAAFHYSVSYAAEEWLRAEILERQKSGESPRLIMAGHSLGATEACEMGKRILRRYPEAFIELLITVDAIKSGTIGSTTGMAGAVLMMGKPIPGTEMYLMAYSRPPKVDGKHLLYHTNYYHEETTLYHGSAMTTASENHPMLVERTDAVNHGNIDDYAYPLIKADIRTALKRDSKQ